MQIHRSSNSLLHEQRFRETIFAWKCLVNRQCWFRCLDKVTVFSSHLFKEKKEFLFLFIYEYYVLRYLFILYVCIREEGYFRFLLFIFSLFFFSNILNSSLFYFHYIRIIWH